MDDAVNFIILITLVINVIEQNLSLDVNSHSVNSKPFTKPEHSLPNSRDRSLVTILKQMVSVHILRSISQRCTFVSMLNSYLLLCIRTGP
jgi:hypothetical protein